MTAASLPALPEGAWDTHAHVIGDPAVHPLAPGRGYDPPRAALEAYLALLDRHGIDRGLLVQPSVYGFDHRCMLDALDRAGGRLLGVAVPSPDATSADLHALHRRRVRGVRCNLLNRGGLPPDRVLRWRPVLLELGWHLELHVDAERWTLQDPRPFLDRVGIPVIIDHMGRPGPGRSEPTRPGPRRLVELVREGRCYVKLSAPYRLSSTGPPWSDVVPLARELLAANPDRCVWASDWPHTQTEGPVHDEDLVRALVDWCPDAERRRRVLVETPLTLLDPGPGTP